MSPYIFNLKYNNKRTFNLTVFGFSLSSTMIANIKQRFPIVFAISLSTDWAFPLVVKKATFIFNNSLIKLKVSPNLSIMASKPVFTIIFRQAVGFVAQITTRTPKFTVIMKLATKIPSWNLSTKKPVFVFAPIIAKFAPLSSYDAKYLWEIDGTTLQTLDYTLVS